MTDPNCSAEVVSILPPKRVRVRTTSQSEAVAAIRARVLLLADKNRHLGRTALLKWLWDLADVSTIATDEQDLEYRRKVWRAAIEEAVT